MRECHNYGTNQSCTGELVKWMKYLTGITFESEGLNSYALYTPSLQSMAVQDGSTCVDLGSG